MNVKWRLSGEGIDNGLWQRQVLYLRTRSRELPSENTVRQILAPMLAREFYRSCPNSLGWKIREI